MRDNKFYFHSLEPEEDDPSKIIAVDLGYSKNRPSCGIYFGDREPKNCRFGKAIKDTVDLISELDLPVILTLEGPLSKHHDPSCGSPTLRGTFEKGRGWYYGAGALTCLAAQRFIEVLGDELSPDNSDVLLAEAFLSNKEGKTPDEYDARIIYEKAKDMINEPETKFWKHDEEWQTIRPEICGIPPVLIVEP